MHLIRKKKSKTRLVMNKLQQWWCLSTNRSHAPQKVMFTVSNGNTSPGGLFRLIWWQGDPERIRGDWGGNKLISPLNPLQSSRDPGSPNQPAEFKSQSIRVGWHDGWTLSCRGFHCRIDLKANPVTMLQVPDLKIRDQTRQASIITLPYGLSA
jgi:hypothetical protein